MTRAYERTIRYRDNRALTRQDFEYYTPAVLAQGAWNGVSTRYTPISTISIIDELNDAGFMAVAAMQSNSRIPGKYGFTLHQVLFRAKNWRVVGDDGVPEFLVRNDNSAEAAFSAMAAYFRLVCANGLVLVNAASDVLRVVHVNTTANAVVDAVLAVAKGMESKLATIADMKQVMLTSTERTHLAERVAVARYGQPRIVDGTLEYKDRLHYQAFLRPRYGADNGNDLWRVLNTAQYRGINGDVCLKGYDRARRVTSLDAQLKINTVAWQAASELLIAHTG